MAEIAVAVGAFIFGAGTTAAATTAAVITAVAVGVAVGAVIGAATALITGGDILDGALKGALIGGVTAGVFKGVNLAWSAYSTSVEAGVDVSVNAPAPIQNASAIPTTSVSSPDPTKFTDAATKGLQNVSANTSANAGMSDAASKIWAGVGQGAAAGIGQVGAAMMEGDNYKDALEEKRKYEEEKTAKNFSTGPLESPKTGTWTKTDPLMATSAEASLAAPTADVNARYQSDVAITDPKKRFEQEAAQAKQGTEGNWWMSHFKASTPVQPQQQQVRYA